MKTLLAASAALLMGIHPLAHAQTGGLPVRPGLPSASAPSPTLGTPPATATPMPPVGSTPSSRTGPVAPSRPLNRYSVSSNIALFGILFGGLTATQAKSMKAATVEANCKQAVADGRLPPGLNCAELSQQALAEIH